MKREIENYCEAEGVEIIEIGDDTCSVDLPRSAETISRFIANSPIPSDSEIDLFKGLDQLVDKDGLKLLEFGNWKLNASPSGRIPPKGGMLRLTVKF